MANLLAFFTALTGMRMESVAEERWKNWYFIVMQNRFYKCCKTL